MPRPNPRLLIAPLALCLVLLCSGCGGGGESLTHIHGSSATITKPMLDHWMRTMAGGDFRTIIGTKGPVGLVSEPANYTECEAAARKVVPRTYSGQLKLSATQISRKCHELYRSIKAQALTYLLSVQWIALEGAEQGLKLSDAELHREFAQYRKENFPTEADLRRYLQERHWTLADVLYQLKRNILVQRILPKFQVKVKQAGGGEAAYARLALARYKRQIARTTCTPGYVAPGCKEYHGPETVLPPPAVIIEQLAEGVSG